MTVMTQIILAVALVLSIIVPFGYYFIGEKSRGRYKTTIATNAFFFFGTMLVAAMVMFAGSSSVQAATGADAGIATGLGYIAAALVTGLSCIGGGIAVASAASAALGAISEDRSESLTQKPLYSPSESVSPSFPRTRKIPEVELYCKTSTIS